MFCWRGLKPGAIVAAALALRRALDASGKAGSDSRAEAGGSAAALRAEPG